MAVAVGGVHLPRARPAVECRARHRGAERVVAAKVEAVGDVLEISQDLRLRGVALGPCPGLLQVVVERVGVVDAFDVAPRSRVAIPVPRAAHAVRGLDAEHRQPRGTARCTAYSPAKPAPITITSCWPAVIARPRPGNGQHVAHVRPQQLAGGHRGREVQHGEEAVEETTKVAVQHRDTVRPQSSGVRRAFTVQRVEGGGDDDRGRQARQRVRAPGGDEVRGVRQFGVRRGTVANTIAAPRRW